MEEKSSEPPSLFSSALMFYVDRSEIQDFQDFYESIANRELTPKRIPPEKIVLQPESSST